MALHRKLSLIVLALTAGYMLLGYSILRAIVYPTFTALEHRAARGQVARVEDRVRDIELEISLVNMDWAQWDDSVEFLRAPIGSDTYEAYKKANLKISDMVNYDLDLLLLFDARDRLVWGQFLTADVEVVPLEEVLATPFEAGDPLLAHENPVGSIDGLLQTRIGPVIVSSRPIVTNAAEGPPEGTMIMGRLLTPDRVEQIGQQTDSEFHLFQITLDEFAPNLRSALDRAPHWPEDPLSEADEEILLTYSRLNDVYGQPAFLLQLRTPREIVAAGATTLRLAAFFFVLAATFFAGGLWLLLRRLMQTEAQRSAMEEARDAALEVARIKSEFLATMSHEMRTPMNGVIGLSELLLDTALTDRQRSFARDIQCSAEGLLGIINDVLDFSKIEAGKMASETRDFDLRAILEHVSVIFARNAQESGLELSCDISPGLEGVWRGDPDRLRKVLINLVGNAFKFTLAGEVLIRAHSGTSDGGTHRIRIEVQDSGIGIAPERQAKIFDSFTQADTSTTREFGGTGLGLAISKRLVELMGGAMGVQSEPGRGSTFWLEIPLERGAAATPSTPSGIRGLRVLVVDDNATSRSLLRARLEAWGARCRVAGSAWEALATLGQASSSFDAVLIDQVMPDMDGPSLARAIAAEPGLENLHVVLMSFVPLPEGREPAGVRSQLRKPVRAGELAECLCPAQSDAAEESARRGSDEDDATRGRALDARVLLVEDNPVNQRVAVAMLEGMGCHVDAAPNGREALSLRERNSYDLILMDCQMPVLDGYQTTVELRRLEAESGTESRIPIIALTANAVEGDRERCLAAGMSDYLSKPFKREQLRDRIEHWLGTAAVAASDQVSASSDEPQTEPEGGATLDKAALNLILEIESPSCPDLLGKLVQTYRETSQELLEEIEASIEAGDAERLSSAAHALKSSSANLGASALAALSLELEQLGRAGTLAGAKDLFARLSDEHPRVLRALQAELATDPS
jgi:signal transduction histidine kinase/CheY-like chemotaxis protein/HPt (histidine-containing phosphotransfer) domain-containing protein